MMQASIYRHLFYLKERKGKSWQQHAGKCIQLGGNVLSWLNLEAVKVSVLKARLPICVHLSRSNCFDL
jgi:hypothetical protein